MPRFPEGRTAQVGCALVAGIVAAPFLAVLYQPDAGLAVAALALAATAFLAWDASRVAEGTNGRRMVLAAAANALLAVVMIVMLVLRRIG